MDITRTIRDEEEYTNPYNAVVRENMEAIFAERRERMEAND